MYKVICLYNGTTYTLHDPLSDDLRVFDDEVVTEDSQPGSFTFSVSYDHPYIDKIVGLSSDIRVYDGDEEIFRGRPIDDGEDLYRTRTFKCEGELAFLYDSIQPRRELHNITPLQFFTLLIEEHNAQVRNSGPIDKTFRVGTVTVVDSNNSLYRYTNRETTLDDILDKLIDRLGGHLCVRISGGVRYLDLLADVETVYDQPIMLGDNLMTYASNTDYTEVATACIPLGCSLEETEIAALDAYLTVAEVNNGSDVIQINTAVSRYGFICKVLHFDDITVPANLKSAGESWLTDGQYANLSLDMTAVDLHGLGYDLQPIRKNRRVRVVSEPHGMDRSFIVAERTYHLSTPEADRVSIGNKTKKTYTSSAKSAVSSVEKHAEQTRMNIDSVIDQERDNVTNLLNQATHGYVVLDPNSGPERILIMDTNSVETATKIWKWDLNGLGYSSSGINGPWGTAITMAGQIVANYVSTGVLNAGVVKAGILTDVNETNYWNMETGEFRLSTSTLVGDDGTTDTIPSLISDATSSLRSALESQIDAKIETWAQSTNPATAWTTTALRQKHDGDLWLYTGTTNLTIGSVTIKPQGVYQYDYNSGSPVWTAYSSTSDNLFDLADGKASIYYGTFRTGSTSNYTPSSSDKALAVGDFRLYGSYTYICTDASTPTWERFTAAETGDYLVDGYSGCTYRWTGSGWSKQTDYATAIDDYDSSLDQEAVFNKLTVNGTKQGITMDASGNLYINATYINSGTLTVKDSTNGTIFSASLASKSVTIGGWTATSTKLYNGTIGYSGSLHLSTSNLSATIAGQSLTDLRLTVGASFGVTSSGKLYATGASLSGEFFCGSSSGYWTRLNTSGQMVGGKGTSQYGYIDFSGDSVDVGTGVHNYGIQIQGGILRISTTKIAVAASSNVSTTATYGATGTMRVIYRIDSDGTHWWYDYDFINGILVSQPHTS